MEVNFIEALSSNIINVTEYLIEREMWSIQRKKKGNTRTNVSSILRRIKQKVFAMIDEMPICKFILFRKGSNGNVPKCNLDYDYGHERWKENCTEYFV